MRTAAFALLGMLVAAPAMAQGIYIQPPGTGYDQSWQHEHAANVNRHQAQRDRERARWQAEHGNYLGASRSEQQARSHMNNARRQDWAAHNSYSGPGGVYLGY